MCHAIPPTRWQRHPLPAVALASVLVFLGAGSVPAEQEARDNPGSGDRIQLRDPLNDSPLALDYRPDQKITQAVERFHATGTNPYRGDENAISAGRDLYRSQCQACHMPDGTGRIGPSLVDGESGKYPRVGTDIGDFEIIYAGGAGAMQAFGRRMDQDDILKVMAYVDRMRQEASE